jgi:hypothetical protein
VGLRHYFRGEGPVFGRADGAPECPEGCEPLLTEISRGCEGAEVEGEEETEEREEAEDGGYEDDDERFEEVEDAGEHDETEVCGDVLCYG